jgi:uncharacterized iron-regulated membrane protein
VAFPATLFLLWAGTTGVIVAGTEFFGEEEEKREALRTVVSTVTTTAGSAAAEADLARAFAAVATAAAGAPIDKITLEFKGERTVTVFTGKPAGGEDRKFVIDAGTGTVRKVEDYADKPFVHRLHSGEAFGDGGLVFAMAWGATLVWLTVSGFIIYWRMRRREATGLERIFW